jgi:hypothetical protein
LLLRGIQLRFSDRLSCSLDAITTDAERIGSCCGASNLYSEVLSSNLDWTTEYVRRGFRGFSQFLQANAGVVS